jgi:CRP/FNR family transcriptional regulator, cyclic AMP receptor protein
MAATAIQTDFIVWGIDRTAYGPVELPTLVAWVKDERVTADTWIYDAKNSAWQKASELPELQMFFRRKSTQPGPDPGAMMTPRGLDPRSLRRIKILASMSDEQLERFAQFMEVEKVPQWSVIVKQGEYGDSMYFILEGELRVRMNVMGKETILATLTAGEFFGDISLFDHGPRSADVVANTDSLVVKISAAALDELAKTAPETATPFLRAIGRTLTARIRADNKRYGDSVRFSRASGA